jgi:hypothetical protein
MKAVDSVDSLQLVNVDHLPVARVLLSSLVAADSPRQSGESSDHARTLAESEDRLPPIVVHRPSMRVVDGMHRLHAAQLRGERDIEVRFLDCDEASSFVFAVRANVMHGLPLSLTDRKAAAARIMSSYPQWSDRMIASATGLAAKTVAAARKRPSAPDRQLDTRVGRDGRARPVDGARRREIVAQVMADNPNASLREVARRAGVSPETARSVRARLGHGGAPSARRHRADEDAGKAARRRSGQQPSGRDAGTVSPGGGSALQVLTAGRGGRAGPNGLTALQALRADPAFRSTENGRSLLWMLATYWVLQEHGRQLIENVPAHSMSRVAEAVEACAHVWQDFAERVEQQRKTLAKGNL